MAGDVGREVHVFSRAWRHTASAYVLVTVVVVAVVGTGAEGRRPYLTALALASALTLVPAVVAAPRARRGVVADRTALHVWYVGWAVLYVGEGLVYLAGVRDWAPGRPLVGVAAAVGIAAFGVGNTLALRERSGQRHVGIDVVDLLVATVAVLGPAALLVAEPVVSSPDAWLAVPAAAVVACAVHATGAYVLMAARLPAGLRGNVGRRLVLSVLVAVDAAGQVAQAVSGFTLPAAPLLALHALCMGGSIDLAMQALAQAPTGLSRLPPQRQVRKNGVLAALVVASVAVVVAVTAWRGAGGPTLASAVGLLAVVAVASAVRQAWLGRETVRLYGEVERAADERRELLTEVMRYLDGDRPRAAAKLHEQAAMLYTATAWPSQAAADALAPLRRDLARRVDASRQALLAIRQTGAEAGGAESLAALTRAYVSVLYEDGRRPVVRVTVAEGLTLDWMDEVLAFRIIQLALDNVRRHAGAAAVAVAVEAPGGALAVTVGDDGVGFDPAAVAPGRGLRAAGELAELVGGRVTVDSTPGGGTRLRAVLGAAAPAPPPPGAGARRLRVVG